MIQKKSKKNCNWMAVLQRKSLFECISRIMATNTPRKKKCHPLKSAFCLWQVCITDGVICFRLRSYISAETEKYQINCRQYTNYCNDLRQLILSIRWWMKIGLEISMLSNDLFKFRDRRNEVHRNVVNVYCERSSRKYRIQNV